MWPVRFLVLHDQFFVMNIYYYTYQVNMQTQCNIAIKDWFLYLITFFDFFLIFRFWLRTYSSTTRCSVPSYYYRPHILDKHFNKQLTECSMICGCVVPSDHITCWQFGQCFVCWRAELLRNEIGKNKMVLIDRNVLKPRYLVFWWNWWIFLRKFFDEFFSINFFRQIFFRRFFSTKLFRIRVPTILFSLYHIIRSMPEQTCHLRLIFTFEMMRKKNWRLCLKNMYVLNW